MNALSLEINLVDELLAMQRTLTPVERFAQRHERGEFPSQARYYRDLIPSSKPGKGQQYAFAINLDACTGCKACVSACHSLNGLEEHETWRDVGLITGTDAGKPIPSNGNHGLPSLPGARMFGRVSGSRL
jgi:formate dehydrogenase iron-sulfur subunit